MFRKSALAAAMLGALASQSVFGLGLGGINLKSALNQPLDAEVELLSATDKDIQELKVSLASMEAFSNAGIDRPVYLTKLRFEPVRKPDGSAVIKVSSRDSIREPFIDFLIQVVWANGKMLREYTVLVDPPVTMPAQTPAPQAPRASAPAPAPAPAPARAPVRTSAPIAATRQTVPAGDVGRVSGDTYGPTGRNDTLWTIAEQVRPDTGVTMEQTMLGLLNANPDAFIGYNINNLKAGYVLRIPDRAELASVSVADARAEVRTQNQEWREGRSRPARSADVPAATAAEPATGKLELTAPDDGDQPGGAMTAAGDADLDTLRRELTLATEAAEVQARQTEEMGDRLRTLEEQIAKMQRLIELKDDQLALLRQEMGGEAAPATPSGDEAAAPGGMGADAIEDELFLGEGEVPAEPAMEAATDDMAAPTEAAPEEAAPEATPPVAEAPREEVSRSEPAPFEESQSLIDRIMANPLWIAAGVVVLALLAILGLRRRATTEPEFQESILQEREVKPTRASAPVVEETPESHGEPEHEAVRSGESESSLLSEFATSDLGAIQNQSEADPLAEADVYLAYGRYQQAEDLIRNALDDHPDREDLNLKLFEIYAAAQNTSDFDAHAEKVLASLENRDNPLWEKVAEMGRDLNPGNPLYQPGGAAPAPQAEADVPDDNGLDFDLDLGGEAGEGTSQEPSLDSLDFDLGMDEAPEGGGEHPDEERKPAAEESNAMDFDLGDIDLDQDFGAVEAGEPATAEPEEEGGDGLLSDMDEVATKLDLARAYIDMGDPDGARSILDEVLEEGNDAQQDEARGLLAQL